MPQAEFRTHPVLALLAALAALFGSAPAMAQRVELPVQYIVRPGDTLVALAIDYMNRKQDYAVVQKLNNIANPRRLPIGSTLLVPVGLLRMEPVTGVIASFRGDVSVSGQPAAVGMKILQGMRVETGANAFVTVQLPDTSSISLPSQSRISVVKLRRILLTGAIQRTFRVSEGRASISVNPIRDPGSDFQVTTPLSVAAVRGTEFRIGFDEAGGKALTEVVDGTVGVTANADASETGVPKGFGLVSTPSGSEGPVALLSGPGLAGIEKTASGDIVVAITPMEGAKSYRTQFATDIKFLNVIADQVSDTPGATFSGLGEVAFFVRLTAIAPSGLEGLPATYVSGRKIGALDLDMPAAGSAEPTPIDISMTGDGRSQLDSSRLQAPLR